MPFKHNLAFNGQLKKMSTFVFFHRQNLKMDKIICGHIWTFVDTCRHWPTPNVIAVKSYYPTSKFIYVEILLSV